MSNTSNIAKPGGDDSRSLTNDELAIRLIQCAALVKKGEKGQLVRDTIYDLTFYLTGKLPNGARNSSSSSLGTTSTSSTNVAVNIKVAPLQQQSSPIPPQQEATAGQVSQTSQTPLPPSGVESAAESNEIQRHQGEKSHHSRASSSDPIPAARIDNQQTSSRQEGTVSKATISPIKSVLGRVVQEITHPERSHSSKVATSEKNAVRVAADIQQGLKDASISSTTNESEQQQPNSNVHARQKRPAFHRPTNPNTPIIANGWIEQSRRSKMRTVWKEVLASLVEGRKPGEETTFWIQRETGTYNNGKPDLEALHQIPVKWISAVRYDEFSTDYKFTIRLSNLNEEFCFRCEGNEEAAQNWVLTLRSANEVALRTSSKTTNDPVSTRLEAGSWDSTNSQTRSDDEKKLHEQQQTAQPSQQFIHPSIPSGPQNQHQPPPIATQQNNSVSEVTQRMSVKELRAIAHGAGIMTHGMERRDLERVVDSIARPSSVYNPGPQPAPHSATPSVTMTRPQQSSVPHVTHVPTPPPSHGAPQPVTSNEILRQQEEEHRRVIAEKVRQQQEMEKRRRDEEERSRLEKERIRLEEEAHRKRVADLQATAERQRQEELQRRQQHQWQQQQQEWQKQEAEQRATEERRRHEEAARAHAQQQQQWHQQKQQQAGTPNQQWHGVPPQYNGGPPAQHPQFPGGHPPPNFPQQANPAHQRSNSAPHHPQQPQSAANVKYAKMAQQSDDDKSASLQSIKHGVLLQWALCPPTMQMLKPIEHLIAEMPNTFPPRFNVSKHDHFTKWTPMRPDEVCLAPGRPDPDKLNKTMRKLRLFLHPDKLPRDFTKEQEHLCKLLWDITSDAYEDFKKGQDDLSWVRS